MDPQVSTPVHLPHILDRLHVQLCHSSIINTARSSIAGLEGSYSHAHREAGRLEKKPHIKNTPWRDDMFPIKPKTYSRKLREQWHAPWLGEGEGVALRPTLFPCQGSPPPTIGPLSAPGNMAT